jgi:Leucine carboxyl methyltransferase
LSEHRNTRQIISLGSGSDTRFFRLKQKYPEISLIYHEFDFPANTAAKIGYMQMPPFMQSVQRNCNIDPASECITFSTDDAGNESVHLKSQHSTYHLHPLDLRTLARPQRSGAEVDQEFSHFQISRDVPTLVLSECCLIYLPPEDADSVLSYFTSAFHTATAVGVVIYEPIRPHDAFGRTMVSNLTARGIHLQTLHAHDTLGAQKGRLSKHGFGSMKEGVSEGVSEGAEAADVDFIWQTWIEGGEKERVENLEWMDEVEEWRLLARHYCVAWGWRDVSDDVGDSVFSKWAHLPIQDEEG